ncbi:MAG: spore germination protein GerW family protein [Bryobacteraceae bacterium]
MQDIWKSVAAPLETGASVKSVFGEPVETQGKTVIPVARVAFGFGGGGGSGLNTESHKGEGMGGGGGVYAVPLGVFEVTEGDTRFVPVDETRKWLALGLLGFAVGMMCAKWMGRRNGTSI